MSPWPLSWRYLLLLRATVQMCIKEIWWITCCCTVCWSLHPRRCSTHLHTHTVLDLETLGLMDRLWLAHLPSPTNWVGQPQCWVCMCDAGCSSSKIYTPAMLLSRRCGESHPVKCHCKSPVMKQPSLLLLQTWRVLQLSILSFTLATLPLLITIENTAQHYEAIKTYEEQYWLLPHVQFLLPIGNSGIHFKFIAAKSYQGV